MNTTIMICNCVKALNGAPHVHLPPVASLQHRAVAAMWSRAEYVGGGRSYSPFNGLCVCGYETTSSLNLREHIASANRVAAEVAA